jgi:AraC-like DNA-binding protein
MTRNIESDVLSEVLRVVKLDSAFFFNADFSAPWAVQAQRSCEYVSHLSPGAGHLIIYHLVTEGSAYVRLHDGQTQQLVAGDIVTFPHGDEHIIGNGREVQVTGAGKILEHLLAKGLSVARIGGGGELTRIVCGFLACEPQLSGVLLGGLPSLVKVNIRGDSSGQWLENSIRFSVTQANAQGYGNKAVLAKLSEALFVETIRRYILNLPPEQKGWLAGVRDPAVGKALAALHRSPDRAWTIVDLAQEVGISRSVLVERFRDYLGEPPMTYLTQWRLQMGAQKLAGTPSGVAEIAADVGYDSEAAFNRAFKRRFGLPPGRYRKEFRRGRDTT